MTDEARRRIEALFALALDRADPRKAIARVISVEGANLEIGQTQIAVPAGIVLISIGKAAVTMAQGALDRLEDRIERGIAITKDGHTNGVRFERVEIAEASHPIPDERGVAATKRAIELVESAGDDDLVLCLISGGGSALFEAPKEPVTLADLAQVTYLLLKAGARGTPR